jgi:hypothetical protein
MARKPRMREDLPGSAAKRRVLVRTEAGFAGEIPVVSRSLMGTARDQDMKRMAAEWGLPPPPSPDRQHSAREAFERGLEAAREHVPATRRSERPYARDMQPEETRMGLKNERRAMIPEHESYTKPR